MPQYRVSFLLEYGKQGFSEVWYRQADDPVSATVFTTTQLRDFFNLRPKGTLIQAVRSNDVAVPRLGFLNVLDRELTALNPAGLSDGDIPQAAILMSLRTRTGQRRAYMMRCVDDDWITFDDNGAAQFGAALNKALLVWFNALIDMGLQFRILLVADPVNNPDRPVATFAPFGTDFTQTVATYTGTALPAAPVRVIFHKVRRSQFPGLIGSVPTIPGVGQQIVMPVSWMQPAASVNGGPATVRQALYGYATINQFQTVDFRSKKVGAPNIRARGRRAAVHYRSR